MLGQNQSLAMIAILLALILIVLMAGFGFLMPTLKTVGIVGGVVAAIGAIIVSWRALGWAIEKLAQFVDFLFNPIVRPIRKLFTRYGLQMRLLVLALILIACAWLYFGAPFEGSEIAAMPLLGLWCIFAFFQLIGLIDTWTARRKYRRRGD